MGLGGQKVAELLMGRVLAKYQPLPSGPTTSEPKEGCRTGNCPWAARNGVTGCWVTATCASRNRSSKIDSVVADIIY